MGDRHTLLFSQPLTSPHPVDLPPYITRYYIPTPLGTLELLAAEPTSSPTSGPRKKAILFRKLVLLLTPKPKSSLINTNQNTVVSAPPQSSSPS